MDGNLKRIWLIKTSPFIFVKAHQLVLYYTFFHEHLSCLKKYVRRPGIEPGSQEWESCMIPLHQRRPCYLAVEHGLLKYSHGI